MVQAVQLMQKCHWEQEKKKNSTKDKKKTHTQNKATIQRKQSDDGAKSNRKNIEFCGLVHTFITDLKQYDRWPTCDSCNSTTAQHSTTTVCRLKRIVVPNNRGACVVMTMCVYKFQVHNLLKYTHLILSLYMCSSSWLWHLSKNCRIATAKKTHFLSFHIDPYNFRFNGISFSKTQLPASKHITRVGLAFGGFIENMYCICRAHWAWNMIENTFDLSILIGIKRSLAQNIAFVRRLIWLMCVQHTECMNKLRLHA